MARIANHRKWAARIAPLALYCAITGHAVPASAAGGDVPPRLVVAAAARSTGQRLWQIHDFTRIELAPLEAGAPDNRHPVAVAPEALRQQLTTVLMTADDNNQPLFGADELKGIVDPLAQAFAAARPVDDVLLVSASRRGGILSKPTAVTARLFIQEGQLQLIVHDARLDFYDSYRATRVTPRFAFGSRSDASRVSLQAPAGASMKRNDWLSLPLAATTDKMPLEAPAPATPLATPPAAQDNKAVDDIERRLETLKRLHDRGLITEEEYRQKRAEILKAL